MTFPHFFIVLGVGLLLIGGLAFLCLFGFYIAFIKNLHDLSDIKQTNPGLYDEIKKKLQSRFPQFAEPLHLKGDFVWRYLLTEDNIAQLDRADELRSHPAFIKRREITKRLKLCVIIVIASFSVGAFLVTMVIMNK